MSGPYDPNQEEAQRRLIEPQSQQLKEALKRAPAEWVDPAYDFGRACKGCGLPDEDVKRYGAEVVSLHGILRGTDSLRTVRGVIGMGLRAVPAAEGDLAKGHNAKSRMADTDPPDFTDRESAGGEGGASESPGDRLPTDADQQEEWRKQAGDLLTDPDILERFGKAIEADGLVGETNNAKILYLLATTRFFDRPGSAVLKGPSSSGKSIQVEKTLRFFPPEAFVATSSMSDHSLVYDDEDFRHRMLVIYEADGMASDKLSYFIRTLLSEGCIKHSVTERVDGRFVVRKIHKEGPTGLITTTTAAALHPENETRMLSLPVKDGPEQTRAVLRAIAKDTGGKPKTDVGPWHAVQNYVGAGEKRVVIPYAEYLVEKLPTKAVRIRRDCLTLLNLISAHALLHQESRGRDRDGRIVAAAADYEAVRLLVNSVFSEGIKATVSKETRATVDAVVKLLAGKPEGVSQADIGRELGLDRAAISHRVRKAIAGGYLVNHETKEGLPARLKPHEAMPGEVEVLPEFSADWAKPDAPAGAVEAAVEAAVEGDTQAGAADLAGDWYPSHKGLNGSTSPENSSNNNGLGVECQTQRSLNGTSTSSTDVALDGGTVEALSPLRGERDDAEELDGATIIRREIEDEMIRARRGNGDGQAAESDLDQRPPQEPEEDLRPF
jgi:hypothetical protein